VERHIVAAVPDRRLGVIARVPRLDEAPIPVVLGLQSRTFPKFTINIPSQNVENLYRPEIGAPKAFSYAVAAENLIRTGARLSIG
jgi:hypothetical protein